MKSTHLVRRCAGLAAALAIAAVLAPRAYAHHSFATEFDSSLEGEVKGVSRASGGRTRTSATTSR